jgi:hypothetical protein
MKFLPKSTRYIAELLEAGYAVRVDRHRMTRELEFTIEKASCGARGSLSRHYENDDLCVIHLLRNIVIELDNRIRGDSSCQE